jgi:DNA-binding IscR family transcriptional regulator
MNALIQILEGPIGIMDCSADSNCVQLDICNIRKPINRVNEAIVSMFDNLTLADITRH